VSTVMSSCWPKALIVPAEFLLLFVVKVADTYV
jgi:hypothetical protein